MERRITCEACTQEYDIDYYEWLIEFYKMLDNEEYWDGYDFELD